MELEKKDDSAFKKFSFASRNQKWQFQKIISSLATNLICNLGLNSGSYITKLQQNRTKTNAKCIKILNIFGSNSEIENH